MWHIDHEFQLSRSDKKSFPKTTRNTYERLLFLGGMHGTGCRFVIGGGLSHYSTCRGFMCIYGGRRSFYQKPPLKPVLPSTAAPFFDLSLVSRPSRRTEYQISRLDGIKCSSPRIPQGNDRMEFSRLKYEGQETVH